jgi:hypothetical protein
MIKKVSNSQSNSYEIPGAKFKISKDSCEYQCMCDFCAMAVQFQSAHDYYNGHYNIYYD